MKQEQLNVNDALMLIELGKDYKQCETKADRELYKNTYIAGIEVFTHLYARKTNK